LNHSPSEWFLFVQKGTGFGLTLLLGQKGNKSSLYGKNQSALTGAFHFFLLFLPGSSTNSLKSYIIALIDQGKWVRRDTVRIPATPGQPAAGPMYTRSESYEGNAYSL
jgi:hypothetical protein